MSTLHHYYLWGIPRVGEDSHVVVEYNIDEQVMAIHHIECEHYSITHPHNRHGILVECCHYRGNPDCDKTATKLEHKNYHHNQIWTEKTGYIFIILTHQTTYCSHFLILDFNTVEPPPTPL